jgi:hypothetical protein
VSVTKQPCTGLSQVLGKGRKKVSALQIVKHFPTRDQSYKIFYTSCTEGFDNKVPRKNVRIIPEKSI